MRKRKNYEKYLLPAASWTESCATELAPHGQRFRFCICINVSPLILRLHVNEIRHCIKTSSYLRLYASHLEDVLLACEDVGIVVSSEKVIG